MTANHDQSILQTATLCQVDSFALNNRTRKPKSGKFSRKRKEKATAERVIPEREPDVMEV